jgi:hypothetical protein
MSHNTIEHPDRLLIETRTKAHISDPAVLRRLNCPRCKGNGVYHSETRLVAGVPYRFAKTCDHRP